MKIEAACSPLINAKTTPEIKNGEQISPGSSRTKRHEPLNPERKIENKERKNQREKPRKPHVPPRDARRGAFSTFHFPDREKSGTPIPNDKGRKNYRTDMEVVERRRQQMQ